jgi:peptidoglycan/LPS O-acetylase OafA/YrhL
MKMDRPGGSHANSLDLVRIFAALCVLYSHQYVMLGYQEPSFLGWQTFGGAGVSIFFFLSGALVSESWIRDPNLTRFFARRALRIFPALIGVVFLLAFVVGPVMTTRTLTSYFSSSETWRYLATAILWIHHQLPGVFADHPFSESVNGSLWSLPLEFLCYVALALVGLLVFGRGEYGRIVATGGVLCVVIAVMNLVSSRFQIHLEMVATFWFGVLFYGLRRRRERHRFLDPALLVMILLSLLFYACTGPRGIERTMMLFFSGGLVFLGMALALGASLTNRLGDISYGLYIYAFPVQQMVAAGGKGHDWPFAVHLTLSLILTTILAWLSWHLLEKKALRYKPPNLKVIGSPVALNV